MKKAPPAKDIVFFPGWKKYGADAGVTTKLFPVFLKKTDDLDHPANRFRLEEALRRSPSAAGARARFPGRFAYLQQVHGGKVAVLKKGAVPAGQKFTRLGETDGVITDIPGLTLLAMTADCLSVYFYAPGWSGVVHAGWRGTQLRIAETAAKLILRESGRKPSELRVIFGPSICGKHYEVGPEFKAHFPGTALSRKKEKYYFDLTRENENQLRALGVPAKNFHFSDLCTVSGGRRFYSFRKEKESAGRMISFIQITA